MSLGDWFWVIPVFGLLIFFHELGHFGVAKLFGIRIHEFALGFGPVVVGVKRAETRYTLRLFPLGGFVRMAGMEESDADDPSGFNRKSVLARSLVIAAGPAMNFLLAAVLYSSYFYFVGTVTDKPILGVVMPQCAVTEESQAVMQPCPAQVAGLKEGDRVLQIGKQPITRWNDILLAVKASDGKPMIFVVERDQTRQELQVTPLFSDGRWLVGIGPSTEPVPLGKALIQGPIAMVNFSVAWVGGISQMITGQMEPQLSGPVGITRVIAEEASRGLDRLLLLTAFLSINLGWFNLLPIPALDGSRLLFMGLEAVRGRRMDPHRENMIHFVGFLVLIGLIVVVTYGDFFKY